MYAGNKVIMASRLRKFLLTSINLTIYILCIYKYICGARGGVVVKALRYKPAGRGFDYLCPLEFFSDIILPVDSASNRNEYQVYFMGVKAARA